jgi:citrate synthase
MEDIMSKSGLDGVVAADTRLSHVDGEAGQLIVAGHELPELVRDYGFEGTTALLWDGLAPEGGNRAAVSEGLGKARQQALAHVPALLTASKHLTVVEALRVGLGLLPDNAKTPHHLLATAALPVFLAALLRRQQNKPAVAPDPTLSTAQDLLRMMRDERASQAEEKALDAYLTTITDHGFNASTFASRVIASTQAGLISAVIGGLCALKGPLHGGAPGPVLDMLDEIGSSANILPWLEQAVQDGERLMGFGHRIYKVRDPRADVLKAVVPSLSGQSGRMQFAAEVEAGAIATLRRLKPNQRLDTNVEFYTALVLEAVGLPREAFTAVFAVGRVAGWCAHILEQEQTGRIIRPQSRYVGPMPSQPAAA